MKAALYIKAQSGMMDVIGGIFLAIALFLAVLWALGNELEPVVTTLSIISSIFFALPPLARRLYPDRKLVKEMTYGEIVDFIPSTDAKKDWVYASYKNWIGERFLKEDPRLRIRIKYRGSGVQCKDFKEKWANDWLHPAATGYWCDVYYDGNIIDRLVLVAVDEGNCLLPAPFNETMDVSPLSYACAEAFDSLDNFTEYFKKSGLKRSPRLTSQPG